MTKAVSVADRVFDQIEADILDGVYPPGELLTELRLCERLRVSRTPVREALTRLRQEGLAEETSRGCAVVGVNEKDLCDIYDIRERVEGMAAALCAGRITDAELGKLGDIVALQEFYAERGQSEALKNLDGEFHHLVYVLSDNRTLAALLDDLHRKVQRYRRVSVENAERACAAVAEHRAIFDALSARDPVRAEALTVEHIAHAKANILKNLKKK